jgi:hypothetical protein
VPRIFKVWRLRSIFNRVVVLIAIKRPSLEKSLINLFSVVYGKKTKRLKDRLKTYWIEMLHLWRICSKSFESSCNKDGQAGRPVAARADHKKPELLF